MSDLMNTQNIGRELTNIPKWERAGKEIARTFQFEDFNTAMKFVNRVAELADKANHHPDVDIRWNKVTLSLSTHSKGGITVKDFSLAREINEAAEKL